MIFLNFSTKRFKRFGRLLFSISKNLYDFLFQIIQFRKNIICTVFYSLMENLNVKENCVNLKKNHRK